MRFKLQLAPDQRLPRSPPPLPRLPTPARPDVTHQPRLWPLLPTDIKKRGNISDQSDPVFIWWVKATPGGTVGNKYTGSPSSRLIAFPEKSRWILESQQGFQILGYKKGRSSVPSPKSKNSWELWGWALRPSRARKHKEESNFTSQKSPPDNFLYYLECGIRQQSFSGPKEEFVWDIPFCRWRNQDLEA